MKKSPTSTGRDHRAAVLSLFPDPATLESFQRNDPDVAAIVVPRVAAYARDQGLIDRPTEEALRELLQNSGRERAPTPAGFAFGDLMDKLAEETSINQLVDKELRPLCRTLGLPDVQTSMISRMRTRFQPSTRGKQNLLRALAFWIGLERPFWGWDFHSLMQLQGGDAPAPEIDVRAGVRLGFQVSGQGEILEAEALAWLRRELVQCTKELELFYIDPQEIVAATTTVFVSVPRLKGSSEDATLYSRALRDGFALVHQVLVRWGLSPKRAGTRLVVAIAAGPFAGLDTSVQAMLKARMGDDDAIRMTAFVRTCANLAEIKLVFRPEPREVSLYAGDTLSVWVADSLWTHLYYDVVPAVERLMPSDTASRLMFRNSLFLGDMRDHPLLAAVEAQQDNTLLLLEVAKVCLAKGMFHEADRFIALVLANRPLHTVARTLRLLVRQNIAMAQTDSASAWFSFREAVAEGRFILERCQVENEEVYCELGQVYFCMARRLYGAQMRADQASMNEVLRQEGVRHDGTADGRLGAARELVLSYLREAQRCFDAGRTISPSGMGNRSLHWSFRIEALLATFETDADAFAPQTWEGGHVIDRGDVFRTTAKRLFAALGWSTELPGPNASYSELEQFTLLARILQAFDRYDNAVLSPSYRANVKLAFATLMFDFAPVLTVGMLKLVFRWLRESEQLSEALAAKPVGVRTIITCYSQIQPAEQMAARARKTVRMLEEHYGAALKASDETVLDGGRGHKFLLQNFATETVLDPQSLL